MSWCSGGPTGFDAEAHRKLHELARMPPEPSIYDSAKIRAWLKIDGFAPDVIEAAFLRLKLTMGSRPPPLFLNVSENPWNDPVIARLLGALGDIEMVVW